MPNNAFSRLRFRIGWRDALWCAVLLVLLLWAAQYATTNLMMVVGNDPDEGVFMGVARLLNYGHAYGEFFFDQFWMFPQMLALALRVFGDSLQTGRYVVLGLSLLGLTGGTMLARQLGARWSALLVVPFGILNHYYLTQSRVAMADVPSIALMVWAIVGAVAFGRSRHRRWLVLCAVAVTAALLTKPLAIAFVIPIGYAIVAARVGKRGAGDKEPENGRETRNTKRGGMWRIEWGALLTDGLVLVLVGIVTAFPFVNLFDLAGEYARTVGFHHDEAGFYAPALLVRLNGLVSFVSENRMWLALGAFGFVMALRRKPGLVLALGAGEVVSAFVLVQLPPWWHHYTLLAPMLACFAAVGVGDGVGALRDVWERCARLFPNARIAETGLRGRFGELRQGALPALAAALVFAAVGLLGLRDLPQQLNYDHAVLEKPAHDMRQLVRYLRAHTMRGDFVISDNPMVVYLAGALLPPSAVNLPYESTFRISGDWGERLATSLEEYPVKAVVVTSDYKRNPELMRWIEDNFPLVDTAGGTGSNVVFAQVFSHGEVTQVDPEEQEQDKAPEDPDYVP